MRDIQETEARTLTTTTKKNLIKNWMQKKQSILDEHGIKPRLLGRKEIDDVDHWSNEEGLFLAVVYSIVALNKVYEIHSDSYACPHCAYYRKFGCLNCTYAKRHGECFYSSLYPDATKSNKYGQIIIYLRDNTSFQSIKELLNDSRTKQKPRS